jgi:hypothetical protein
VKEELLKSAAKKLTEEEFDAVAELLKVGAAEEPAGPWWQDEKEIKKLANSGLPAGKIEAFIKEAARQHELQNIYADYDAAGRIMAHGYFDELQKLAEQHLSEAENAEKKALVKKLVNGE